MIGNVVVLAAAAVLLAFLPRRHALIPLLLVAVYTTRTPVLELGLARFSALRILVMVGIARVILRGERLAHGVNLIDRLLLVWATVLIGFSAFHDIYGWTYRVGLVWGELGVYVLCRVFLQDAEDLRRLFRTLCVALVPLAVLLLLEKAAAYNYFVGEPTIRDGHVRAYGPFAHPILAGTVGATCLPMALCLWRTHRASAVIGLAATAGIVMACTSSGPIMMVGFICVALLLWNVRSMLPLIRWGTLAVIIGLQIVMNDPVYFLMARIDLTGSSTGWHRAQLIRSSLEHLNEWWAVGTDYTRHWMPTGIHANDISTDITNHFLQMGIWGGVLLQLVFALTLIAAFRAVGRALRAQHGQSPRQAFLIWTLGATLFGHMVNFLSISLFDQSVSFFYLILAAIGAIHQPIATPVVNRLAPGYQPRSADPSTRVALPVGAPALHSMKATRRSRRSA